MFQIKKKYFSISDVNHIARLETQAHRKMFTIIAWWLGACWLVSAIAAQGLIREKRFSISRT